MECPSRSTNAQLDSHNTDNTYYLILGPLGYCTVYHEGAGSTHPAFNHYAAGSLSEGYGVLRKEGMGFYVAFSSLGHIVTR